MVLNEKVQCGTNDDYDTGDGGDGDDGECDDDSGGKQGGTKRCSAVATLHENLSFGRKS